ncbi:MULTISPECIES: DMT family transporter [Flavobacterium]|uniref:DMT family transporter n=1 Tax=Flavobacterium jumunjinense TaxID=998845 RepID=A0ABV5GTX0_9FLAO|nr:MULTISPECIES: DMT family transporter [Flavobacterium]
MKIIFIYCAAFIGGVFLAIQAGFNTQLGSILKQPLIAVISTSITSALFASIALFAFNKDNFQTNHFIQVPTYLWFIGGLCSAIGISLYFYTIPKLGISKMISFGLCGQLAFSLIAGKYGWLNLPIEPITTKHILGILSMIIGIFLINSK